jgi:hypothetical protein
VLTSSPGAANFVALLITALGWLAGAAGFVIFYLAWRRNGQQRKTPRQLPAQWPLSPRQVANSTERKIWRWLQEAFPDHHIIIKLPITRFTAPDKSDDASDLFDLLNTAYCTFTLCDARGLVIGCIDLVGPHGLSQSNRRIKETLLAQCGIGYRALSAQALPSASALHADFVGSDAPPQEDKPRRRPAARQTVFEEAIVQLHETLERQRRDRNSSGYAPLGGANDSAFVPLISQQTRTYQPQADSFLASLDSRRALLGSQ